MRRQAWLLTTLLLAWLLGARTVAAQSLERFIDADDGMFDVSRHLLEYRGVLPVPIVITEPAVGLGGGLVGVLFDQPLGESLASREQSGTRATVPNLTAAGGFKTDNGSWGLLLAHRHTWNHDRYRYLGGVGKADMQFDHYGLTGQPRAYRLEGIGLVQQLTVRLGDSDWFAGVRYAFMQSQPTFSQGWPEGLERPPTKDTRIGRLSLVIEHDTRDNLFSPRSGHFVEAEAMLARPGLGGNVGYEQFNLRGHHWEPVGNSLVLGLRGDLQASRGDIPFFAQPYVKLRGLPALRYQDRHAGVAEAEIWWLATPRWSLLGFGGAGKAWGKRDIDAAATTLAAGVGFRYLIARRLGVHAGLDVARGPEQTVVYIQVGSAWR